MNRRARTAHESDQPVGSAPSDIGQPARVTHCCVHVALGAALRTAREGDPQAGVRALAVLSCPLTRACTCMARAPRAPAAAGCAGNAPCGCCAHALTHARACTRAHAGEYARACACAHAATRQHPPGRRPARAPRAPAAAATPATPSRLRRWPWCARAPDFRLLSGGNSTHGAKAKHAD